MLVVFKSRALPAVFGITMVVVTANFFAYTYITPFLEQMAGQSEGQISMLQVYGTWRVDDKSYRRPPYSLRGRRFCTGRTAGCGRKPGMRLTLRLTDLLPQENLGCQSFIQQPLFTQNACCGV